MARGSDHLTVNAEHLPSPRPAFVPRGAFGPRQKNFSIGTDGERGVLSRAIVAGRSSDARDVTAIFFDAVHVNLSFGLPRGEHTRRALGKRLRAHDARADVPPIDASAREVRSQIARREQ